MSGTLKDYKLDYEEMDEGRYARGIPAFVKREKKRNRNQRREDAEERTAKKGMGQRQKAKARVRKWETAIRNSTGKQHQRKSRVQNRAR